MLFVSLFRCIFYFEGILRKGTLKNAHTKTNKRYAQPSLLKKDQEDKGHKKHTKEKITTFFYAK